MQERLSGFIFLFCITIIACNTNNNQPSKQETLFQLQPSSQTGINFANTISDTKDFNILTYHNFYNGGGVAIGDVNNDGKPDIFFTSNQQQCKMYLNKGDGSLKTLLCNQKSTQS